MDRLLEHHIEMEKRDAERMADLNATIVRSKCFVCGRRLNIADKGDEGEATRVCWPCGGRKKQLELEENGFGELLNRFAHRKDDNIARPVEPTPPAPTAAELDAVIAVAGPRDEVDELDHPIFETLNQPVPVPAPEAGAWNRFREPDGTAGTTPSEPEVNPVSNEPKLCPHCGKKLRIDNTRGACSKCLAKGKSVPAGDDIDVPVTRKKPKDGVEIRFGIVVDALGLQKDQILAELMQSWLDGLKTKIGGAL